MADSSRSLWRRVWPSLWWLVALCLLLMAVYVVVARQLMLLVPDYREPLERFFQERVQTRLEIAELSGHMDGLTPQFVARQLSLPAAEGEAPLELGEVVLSVDVLRSLLHRDLVLEALHIDDVALHLVRDEQGKFLLRGLEALSAGNADAPPIERILDLFYRQQMLTISNARLSLEWPGMPPLAASSLAVTLVNDGDNHLLSATLEARDRPLTVAARIHLYGKPYRQQDVDADVYLNVRGERMHEWLPATLDWPLALTSLDADLALWGKVEAGQPRTARLALSVPSLVLSQQQEEWPLTSLAVDLSLERAEGQATLTMNDFAAQSPAGQLLIGDAGLQWQTRGEDRQWTLRTGDLPVRAINQQFMQWPFALPDSLSQLQARLQRLSPQGVVDGVYLTGRGSELSQFQARFTSLSSKADDAIPGVSRLSGWVAGSPQQGVAHLYSDDLALTFDRLYDHPLRGQMAAVLGWQREGDDFLLRSGRLQAVNRDAHGEAMFAARFSPGEVPSLRLAADIYQGQAARARHYIPLKRLSQGLSGWLGQAIQGGQLLRGQLLYQGPVKIDKTRQQDRTFQMRYQASDVALSYLQDWPAATGVDADVLINGREVRAVARQGQLMNSTVRDVYVDVPAFDLETGPRLIISGQVDGPLEDLDQLFQQTPLQKQLPGELLDWRLQQGKMSGRLLLDYPLQKGAGSPTLIVDAAVTDGAVENAPRDLSVTGVTAPVYFHLREGVQIPDLKASMFGSAMTGQWRTDNGRSSLQLSGDVQVNALRQWLGFSWLAPASGSMPVDLAMQIPWQGLPFALSASSSLKGVTIAAPAPLGKSAGLAVPSTLEISTTGAGPRLSLRYGNRLTGMFRLDDRVAGEVVLGPGQAQIPQQGVAVRGRVNRASVSPWLDFIGEQLVPAMQQGGSEGDSAAGDSPLKKINVGIAELDLFGVAVEQASLSVLPQDKGWDLALNSRSVAGSMHIPDNFETRGEAPLALTVSRLIVDLPESTAEEDSAAFSPLALPTMDVQLDNLQINGEDMGRWSALVRPIQGGARISGLDGRWRATRIEGVVDWTAQEGNEQKQYTRFNGALSSDNLARSLRAWGLPEMIESDDARAKGVIGWNGWPLSPDYLALDGQTRVDIGECRIPQTDSRTSFLRVLGILNIGTIQRRLRLDFSDLYKKGLSCDSISGDFRIDGASVSTSNLAIKSPSAMMDVKGNVDLEKETLDHQIEVTLPLSSNLYAGCLAGPAACAGIFVVERIWGDKLDRTTTMEYAVSGTWSDPNVKETEGIFE